MSVYKNLLQSKVSVSIDLQTGESVPMNDQLYSEWDNEFILYTFRPIFGSSEPVWLQVGNSDLRGLYIEKDNIVIFDPNHIEEFSDLVHMQGIVMIDSIDTLLYIEEQQEWVDAVYTYEHIYIHLEYHSYFSPRNCQCRIDTTPERFGKPFIDVDEDIWF